MKKVLLSDVEIKIIISALITQVSVFKEYKITGKDNKEFLKRTKKLLKELENL